MLLREATFHQVHGGIATNNLDPPQALFSEEYRGIHGKAYERPTRRPLYFGDARRDQSKPEAISGPIVSTSRPRSVPVYN